MKEWILLIELLSPGGDYMDKVPVLMPSKIACQSAAKELPKNTDNPLGVRLQGVCITKEHWQGKSVMKDVPLD